MSDFWSPLGLMILPAAEVTATVTLPFNRDDSKQDPFANDGSPIDLSDDDLPF